MSAALKRHEEARNPFGSSAVVATRPCRMCGQPCDVTDGGMSALKDAQMLLLKLGQQPMDERRIYACERCEMRVRDAEPASNRARVDETAAIIRDLKESSDPPSEREMLARLAELQHPDIPNLLHAIGESKAKEQTKGRRR